MSNTPQPVAGSSNRHQNTVTWYAWGQALPAGKFPSANFERMAFEHLNQPNLVPTTYDASRAYLDEEQKKPEGKRDLLREMCLMIPLRLPEDRKVYLVSSRTKLLIELPCGAMLLFPTTDLPPNSFGTLENGGFLGGNMLVYDPPTQAPQKGTILMAYFTQTGPGLVANEGEGIKLDTAPYA